MQNDQQGEILDLRLVRRARSFDLYKFFRVFDLEQNLPESISICIYLSIYVYIYIFIYGREAPYLSSIYIYIYIYILAFLHI